MAKKSKTKQLSSIPSDLFQCSALQKKGGLESAIRWLNSCKCLEPVISGLITTPGLLEYLLSASPAQTRGLIKCILLSGRSTDPKSYGASLHAATLLSFCRFFGGLAPPKSINQDTYRAHTREAPLVSVALEAVLRLEYTVELPQIEEERLYDHSDGDSDSTFSQLTDFKPSPQPSLPSYTVLDHTINTSALSPLNLQVPGSPADAAILADDLMASQKASLDYFLGKVLVNREMVTVIRSFFLRVVDAPFREAGPSAAVADISHPPASTTSTKPSPETAESSTTGTYATIQPERSREFFDTPEGFGQWHIYISNTALTHLRVHRRGSQKVFTIIQKKIKELSMGHFSASNQKRLAGGDSDAAVYEAKMTGDLRLVYQIDIQTDADLQLDRQVIRIFGVYTHAQFDHRLWARVANALPKKSGGYRHMCNFRVTPRRAGSDVTQPMVWSHEEDTSNFTAAPAKPLTDDQYLELHKMISLEKFIPYSNAVVRSILADIDAVHPFAVSSAETRIINHHSSCFVIGRSGTGKTTTMLFKLLGIECAKAAMPLPKIGEGPRGRQVFLTQSHVLAQRVEEYYNQLFHQTKQTIIGNNAQGKEPSPSSFNDQSLLKLDEEADTRTDLPPRFSELRDEHFPLFVTYDQLRRMLESDFSLEFRRNMVSQRKMALEGSLAVPSTTASLLGLADLEDVTEPLDSASPSALQKSSKRLVTFDEFCVEYWPHFDQRLVKGLDCALVFSEIMGVICGHESTLSSEKGYLDRRSYLNLSTRAHSTFAANRSTVYTIFEKYRNMKYQNRSYDSPDRTHALLRQISQTSVPGRKIDFLYVDEVQDLLTIDTKLLRQLCNNPHGFFWGGDTAQTISVGSSFRFEDLKALMWRDEEADPLVQAGLRQAIHPATFELLINYRSHGGIVAAASSIIDLISSLFPYSIDKLQRELAVVPGPKPCIFRGWNKDVIHFEQFLFGAGDTRMDFGARQVILVRSDEVREELRKQLGDAGLILTLLESKGLEFDDVLLYGFFESSPASPTQWRIVLSALSPESASIVPCDPLKHAVIDSELKHLYVGLTRARHHCWIWDSSPKGDPLVEFWRLRDLVNVYGPSDSIPQLRASSTPDDWNMTGRYLFAKGLYTQALSCFEKAGRLQDRDITFAYQLRKEARAVPRDNANREKRAATFRQAGLAFTSCAQNASDDSGPPLYKKSGECYYEARDLACAADAYLAATEFTEAARLYRDAGLFDQAVALARPTDGSMTKVEFKIADNIVGVARIEYLRTSKFEKAERLFDSHDEQLEFMDDFGFDIGRKSLLKRLKQYTKAAELHLRDGEVEDAMRCFLKSEELASRKRAVACILEGLWSQAFGAKLNDRSQSLLQLLEGLPMEDVSVEEKHQIQAFRAVAKNAAKDLVELARAGSDKATSTLCLECVFRSSSSFNLLAASPAEISCILSAADIYARVVVELIRQPQPCASSLASRLLGFSQVIDPTTSEILPDHYQIAEESFLSRQIKAGRYSPNIVSTSVGWIIVMGRDLNGLIRSSLAERLHLQLTGLCAPLLEAAALQPCLDAAVQGTCNRSGCRRDHSATYSVEAIQLRIRIHLQVIMLLDHLAPYWPLHQASTRFYIHRTWTERLFSTLFPIFPRLGNSMLLFSSSATDLPGVVNVLRRWMTERFYNLHPSDHKRQFLTDALYLSTLSSYLHPEETPSYIMRANGLFEIRPDLIRDQCMPYSITCDMIAFLYNVGHASDNKLARGVSFVNHVIKASLKVDVNVLTHFLERVALEIIINNRPNTATKSHILNNLTLPHDWMLYLACRKQPDSLHRLHGDLLNLLLDTTGRLIIELYEWDGLQVEFLQLNGKPLPRAWIVRAILITRLCRLLVLIGYNGSPLWVRQIIIEKITAIRLRGPHHLRYQKYVAARDWAGMVHALRVPITPGEVDNLICLRQQSSDKRLPFIYGVRCIAFTDLPSVVKALEFSSIISSHNPSTLHDAGAPEDAMSPEDNDLEDPVDDSNNLQRPEDDEHGLSIEEAVTTEAPEMQAELPTELEIRSAQVIQKWYRQQLHRKTGQPQPQADIRRLHSICSANAGYIEHVRGPHIQDELDALRRRRYLMMIRGPLPHVIATLDALLVLIRKAKDDAKHRLPKVQHLELEQVSNNITTSAALYKTALAIGKGLRPNSTFEKPGPVFKSGDVEAMKAGVMKVAKLVEDARQILKEKDMVSLEKNMAIGFRGIVKDPVVKQTVKKAARPVLNTEDLYL